MKCLIDHIQALIRQNSAITFDRDTPLHFCFSSGWTRLQRSACSLLLFHPLHAHSTSRNGALPSHPILRKLEGDRSTVALSTAVTNALGQENEVRRGLGQGLYSGDREKMLISKRSSKKTRCGARIL